MNTPGRRQFLRHSLSLGAGLAIAGSLPPLTAADAKTTQGMPKGFFTLGRRKRPLLADPTGRRTVLQPGATSDRGDRGTGHDRGLEEKGGQATTWAFGYGREYIGPPALKAQWPAAQGKLTTSLKPEELTQELTGLLSHEERSAR